MNLHFAMPAAAVVEEMIPTNIYPFDEFAEEWLISEGHSKVMAEVVDVSYLSSKNSSYILERMRS